MNRTARGGEPKPPLKRGRRGKKAREKEYGKRVRKVIGGEVIERAMMGENRGRKIGRKEEKQLRKGG